MATYKDVDKLIEMYERSADDDWNKRTAPSSWAEAFECTIADIDDQPTADVVPRADVEMDRYKAVDKFRSALMDKFIDLCRGNDYNKINLLLIGETIDRIYDKCIEDMRKEDAGK